VKKAITRLTACMNNMPPVFCLGTMKYLQPLSVYHCQTLH